MCLALKIELAMLVALWERFELKVQYTNKRTPYVVYIKELLALLKGKTGYARSVSTMSVHGSLIMVISPSATCAESCIYVPQYVADQCVVPMITSGHYYKVKLSE